MTCLAASLCQTYCFQPEIDLNMGEDHEAVDVHKQCKITFNSTLDGTKPSTKCNWPWNNREWLLSFAAKDTIVVQPWWQPLPQLLKSMCALSAMACTMHWPYFACAFNLLLFLLPRPQPPASQPPLHPPPPPTRDGHLGIPRAYITLGQRIPGSRIPISSKQDSWCVGCLGHLTAPQHGQAIWKEATPCPTSKKNKDGGPASGAAITRSVPLIPIGSRPLTSTCPWMIDEKKGTLLLAS